MAGQVGAERGWGLPLDEEDPVGAGGEGSAGSTLARKKSRNRKPSSCVPCRRKRIRCNRGAPCDKCSAKGEQDQCTWDDAEPLYIASKDQDAEVLRAEVARLESLVRFLVAQPITIAAPPVFSSNPRDFFTSRSGPSSSEATSPSTHQTSVSPPPNFLPPLAPKDRSGTPPPLKDLRATDLCAALSQLAVRDHLTLEKIGSDAILPGGGTGATFLDQAQGFLDSAPPTTPTVAEPTGILFAEEAKIGEGSLQRRQVLNPGMLAMASVNFSGTAPPIEDALKNLPTEQQAQAAYAHYITHSSWFAHLVHLPSFEAEWKQFRLALLMDEEGRQKNICPFFLATFLGILATGLSMMPRDQAARQGFPGDRDDIVDAWLESAMVSLQCGRFLDNPSIKSVTAVFVLSVYFVSMSNGESSEAGIGLWSLGAQAAMSLGLHRDPDSTPGRYTFLEAEMRRRLFWSIFWVCVLSSSLLGRTQWGIFDLESIDTAFPADCTDEELGDERWAIQGVEDRRARAEETPMTSIISKAKLALLSKKIGARAFGIHPVSYATVLELDRELLEFEASIPAPYRMRMDAEGNIIRVGNNPVADETEMRACSLAMMLNSEFIRIHRPWLVTEASELYSYSREQSVKYSKLLLAVHRMPFCIEFAWGSLSWRAINASVILSLETMNLPSGRESNELTKIVKTAKKQMEAHVLDSNVCRRGARIVGFLLEKQTILAAERAQQRSAKQSLSSEAFAVEWATHLRAAFRTTSASDPSRDELRHKVPNRPSSTWDKNSNLAERHRRSSYTNLAGPSPSVSLADYAGRTSEDYYVPSQSHPHRQSGDFSRSASNSNLNRMSGEYKRMSREFHGDWAHGTLTTAGGGVGKGQFSTLSGYVDSLERGK